MPAAQTQIDSHSLTPAEQARLQILAPKFDIDFHQIDERTYAIKALAENGSREFILPAMVAHRRLLAEVCARAAPWVHFHLGASCRDTLLRAQSEAQLARVAELYARDRDSSRPQATGDCANV